MTAYLIKPVLQVDLLNAIVRALRLSLHGAGSVRPAPLASPTPETKSLSVLLAEDNPVNQAVASRLLQKKGHHVVVAGNGLEALAALKDGLFDLVLMDVQMPQMGGFEATAAIRESERATGRHQPIIAMTAYAMKGDRERCLAAGMDAYVPKPVKAEELFRAINAVLDQPAPTASRRPPPRCWPNWNANEAGCRL